MLKFYVSKALLAISILREKGPEIIPKHPCWTSTFLYQMWSLPAFLQVSGSQVNQQETHMPDPWRKGYAISMFSPYRGSTFCLKAITVKYCWVQAYCIFYITVVSFRLHLALGDTILWPTSDSIYQKGNNWIPCVDPESTLWVRHHPSSTDWQIILSVRRKPASKYIEVNGNCGDRKLK